MKFKILRIVAQYFRFMDDRFGWALEKAYNKDIYS